MFLFSSQQQNKYMLRYQHCVAQLRQQRLVSAAERSSDVDDEFDASDITESVTDRLESNWDSDDAMDIERNYSG